MDDIFLRVKRRKEIVHYVYVALMTSKTYPSLLHSSSPVCLILSSEIHRIAEVHFESNMNDSLGGGGKAPMGHWRREGERGGKDA